MLRYIHSYNVERTAKMRKNVMKMDYGLNLLSKLYT